MAIGGQLLAELRGLELEDVYCTVHALDKVVQLAGGSEIFLRGRP